MTQDPSIFTATLKAVPQSAVLARNVASAALEFWGFDGDAVDAAMIIISELVTNAVVASSRESAESEGSEAEVVVWVFLDDFGGVVLEVWDGSETLPEARKPAPDDEDGRGLLLVSALAKQWGHNRVAGGGKVVWAELPCN